ncbi:MAG TPA: hypothetical protein VK446_01800 [Methylocystis sp.]|nr:hypothetical protein [Methylocystis sp.]
MVDKTEKRSSVIPFELALEASANAPFIYFEKIPNFGFNHGIVNITLEALRYTAQEGNVVTDRVIVAHLRTNAQGLASLKNAIEGIQLLAQKTEPGRPN